MHLPSSCSQDHVLAGPRRPAPHAEVKFAGEGKPGADKPGVSAPVPSAPSKRAEESVPRAEVSYRRGSHAVFIVTGCDDRDLVLG
jgi:hypothetical protein